MKQMLAIPATMERLRPVVHAQVNGRDVTLMVDSGAVFSMLTPAAAASLGLRTEPLDHRLELRGVGGRVDASLTRVDVFTLAGYPMRRVEFIVAGNDLGDGIEGLLGQSVLGIADVEYDLAHGFVRLMRSEHCERSDLAYWSDVVPNSNVTIDRTNALSSHTVGTAYLNGKAIRVVFDSGANVSMLSWRAAERAGVKRGGAGVEALGYSVGVGRRSVPTWLARFDSFRIGDEEIKNARLRIGDIGMDEDMLLGADFFASHRIYVSNAQRRLYFTYSGGPVFDLSRANALSAATDDAPLAEVTVDRQPRDAAGFNARGTARAGRNDLAGAMSDLDRACALDPDDARYRYDRALVEVQLSQRDRALADLDEALRLHPDEPAALLDRARLRIAAGDGPGAVDDLGAASRVMPKEDGRHRVMGDLYLRANQYAAAEAQYDLWLATHPSDVYRADALGGRCSARLHQHGDLNGAVRDCADALALGQDQPWIRLYHGLGLLLTAHAGPALVDLNAVVAADPSNGLARYARGLARLKSGPSAAADEDLAAARRIAPNVEQAAAALGLPPP